MRKRPGNPEPEEAVPIRGIALVAERGTEAITCGAVVVTTPIDSLLTITFILTQPCTAINWGAFVVLMPAVFYPLRDIA